MNAEYASLVQRALYCNYALYVLFKQKGTYPVLIEIEATLNREKLKVEVEDSGWETAR